MSSQGVARCPIKLLRYTTNIGLQKCFDFRETRWRRGSPTSLGRPGSNPYGHCLTTLRWESVSLQRSLRCAFLSSAAFVVNRKQTLRPNAPQMKIMLELPLSPTQGGSNMGSVRYSTLAGAHSHFPPKCWSERIASPVAETHKPIRPC